MQSKILSRNIKKLPSYDSIYKMQHVSAIRLTLLLRYSAEGLASEEGFAPKGLPYKISSLYIQQGMTIAVTQQMHPYHLKHLT